MHFAEIMTAQSNIVEEHLHEGSASIKNHSIPKSSILCGGDIDGPPSTNGSSNNRQNAPDGSIPSSVSTQGHSLASEISNHGAGLNSPLQSGEYMNGQPTNGETIDGSQSHCRPPIAICGLALRLPAGLKTPQQLWDFLLAGFDARSRIPSSRYNVAAFHDPTGKHGTVMTEYGYFLDEDIGALDTSFFSMPRVQVERTDPQHRLRLEVVRECFEDAGETAWRGKRIGCYMGNLGEDWCEMSARETQSWGGYRYTGYGDFALSNRVSYEMDLQGPRFVYLYDFGSRI